MKKVKIRIRKKTTVPTKYQLNHQYRSDWKLVGVIDYEQSALVFNSIGNGPVRTEAQFAKLIYDNYGPGVYSCIYWQQGKEGFGVLTKIDMKQTFKEKIDKDFNKYTILGACNPEFAYEGLNLEEELGLLLPCNVIVSASDSGKTTVAAINPLEVLTLSNNEDIKELSIKVKERLERVIDNI